MDGKRGLAPNANTLSDDHSTASGRGLVEITGEADGWLDLEATAAGREAIDQQHQVKVFDPDVLRV